MNYEEKEKKVGSENVRIAKRKKLGKKIATMKNEIKGTKNVCM